MRKTKACSVAKLAEMSNREADEVLIMLWDAGFNELSGPSDVLFGSKLDHAKRALSIPVVRQLTALPYWQNVLSLEEDDLRNLLHKMGFPMSPQARKLPKGAIKKLSAEVKKRKSVPIAPVTDSAFNLSFQRNQIKGDPLDWKAVGHIRQTRPLTLEEVISIHDTLVADFAKQDDPISPAGPRNESIIASAVFRQCTSIGGQPKYPTVEMCAAALFTMEIKEQLSYLCSFCLTKTV